MREWLTSDTGLKVVALVLATIMWFYVNSITSERRVIEGVRVESITAPHLAVQRISEPTVNVVLRGSHGDLAQITRADLTAVVDLRDQTNPGKIRATLTPDSVRHPQRVQAIQINPTQLYFWLVIAPANNTP
jgi:YbbR domain-containing protein